MLLSWKAKARCCFRSFQGVSKLNQILMVTNMAKSYNEWSAWLADLSGNWLLSIISTHTTTNACKWLFCWWSNPYNTINPFCHRRELLFWLMISKYVIWACWDISKKNKWDIFVHACVSWYQSQKREVAFFLFKEKPINHSLLAYKVIKVTKATAGLFLSTRRRKINRLFSHFFNSV